MQVQDFRQVADSFVGSDRGNQLPGGTTRMYDAPLVAFAAADDPLFDDLQSEDVAGGAHRMPFDWVPDARTVVSYFLPFSEEVRESNRAGDTASEEWFYARFHGEMFNDRLRRLLVCTLEDAGYASSAPALSSAYRVRDLRSNWSERHVAFTAGLGTFGLHAGLITEKGAVGRFGSIVTSVELEPTRRAYSGPNSHCLWFRDGSCGLCADRCPAGALTRSGKDRARCGEHLRRRMSAGARYGFPYSPCGKCYMDVPCEGGIPTGRTQCS